MLHKNVFFNMAVIKYIIWLSYNESRESEKNV